ncbi:MAG: RibD family protein [Methanomicrobiaceae archaeon]|nr:RibD family protein [Methanomicrobiaceae archaeon]
MIIHTTVSLDGAVIGFDIDIGLHYEKLLSYHPDALLVGSTTAKTGIELFLDIHEPEVPADRHRPPQDPADKRPIGVFVDSRGVLHGLLHFYRRLEHTRDVVVLVSETTPEEYLAYLQEREYPSIRCGAERVDLAAALGELAGRFGVETVVSDSGSDLNAALMEQWIADEISLIVTPAIAGAGQKTLFGSVRTPRTMELISSAELGEGRMHLRYRFRR